MDSSETYDVRAARRVPVPVDRLYEAWTHPDLLMQWWGPKGFTCPVAALDVRVGGVSLVAMRAPAEVGMPDIFNTWTYSRVEAGERLEYVSRFATSEGRSISPDEAGIPGGGIPEEVPHVVTFEAHDEQSSRVSVVECGYTEEAARDMSRAGMEQCLDKLEELLSSRDQRSAR